MQEQNSKQENLQPEAGRHQNPLPGEISPAQRELNDAAHRQADKDIRSDAELSTRRPNDDLDEGETARLGEDVPV